MIVVAIDSAELSIFAVEVGEDAAEAIGLAVYVARNATWRSA